MEKSRLFYNLSRSLQWPHTLNEWQLMGSVGQSLSIKDEFRCYASTLLTSYSTHAVIGMVLVDRNFSRIGLGSALSSLALKKAQESQLSNIVLFSSHEAVSMYEKLGFKKAGSISVLTRPKTGSSIFKTIDVFQHDTSAEQIAEKYYGNCSKRITVLQEYINRSEGPFYSELNNGRLVGFAGSIVRIDENNDKNLGSGLID